MRFVPSAQLTAGMVLGQELHDASGLMLLAKNTKLSQENIAYINFIGSAGVYIEDEFSRDIVISPVVQQEVCQEAVSLIHNVFARATNPGDLEPEENLIRLVAESVVSDVLEEEDVIYNMVDIKTYSDYIYFHSMNVGILAAVVGANLNLPEDEMADLVTAAFLHDIGKMFISPELMTLTRELTQEERVEMRAHPQVGYEYLTREFHFSDRVNEAVLQHHEWYDGTGYPQHLYGRDQHRISRILHVVDVYDEMVTKRPQHRAYLPSDVMEYIMGRSGIEFDPTIVSVMVAHLALFPVGSEVVLSDRRHAIVIENHVGYMQRPTVRIVDTREEIDLQGDRNAYHITIVEMLM